CADPRKVHVVPFGANLEQAPTPEQAAAWRAERPTDVCRLLFIGTNWERKGGPLAAAAAEALERQGRHVELAIAGCRPTGPLPACATVYGYISKHTPAGRDLLQRLYARSHFLLLPTRNEAFGLVLAEACAYGVPCLASAIGGIPTIIEAGGNGCLFPPAAGAEAYAAAIGRLLDDPPRYQAMSLAAVQAYQARLNWPAAGQRAAQLLAQAAAGSLSAG
ncbi:MAG: glycosyltransferase family 4 protein, partial [Chloroflexota bacterium]